MNKLLVATDYSENAGHAVDYAVELANHFGSLITLVSAIDEPYSAAAGALVSITDEIRDEAMETMNTVRAQIEPKLRNGATVDVHTVDGEAGPTIARVAKAKGYDLIVMGTRGSTAAKEMFTGSVANAMIKNSEVPVLVVPINAPYRPLKQVVVATDNKGAGPQGQGQKVLNALRENYGSQVINYHDDSDDVARGIKQEVARRNADLLVMLYHDHGFFGSLFNESTVSKVIFDSEVPLLVVR